MTTKPKARPRSISWCDELEVTISRRATEERMTRSEYIRKCVREEAERSQTRKVHQFMAALQHPLAA